MPIHHPLGFKQHPSEDAGISITLRFVTRSANLTLPIFHEPGSLRTHIQKSDQQLSEMKVEIFEL